MKLTIIRAKINAVCVSLCLALAAIGALGSGSATATEIILHSSSFFGTFDGEGFGRGIGLHADSSFSISSLGIFGNLNSQLFDAVIYSSTNGHDAGIILGSASATVGGAGNQYYDIPINFTFGAGSYYTLGWRPTIPSNAWATTLDFYNDSALPTTIGPVTLIAGAEGSTFQTFSNFLHPNLRVDTSATTPVPEPSTILLLASGLAGIFGYGWRRKRAA